MTPQSIEKRYGKAFFERIVEHTSEGRQGLAERHDGRGFAVSGFSPKEYDARAVYLTDAVSPSAIGSNRMATNRESLGYRKRFSHDKWV